MVVVGVVACFVILIMADSLSSELALMKYSFAKRCKDSLLQEEQPWVSAKC